MVKGFRNLKMKQKLMKCIRTIIILFLIALVAAFVGSTMIKDNFQSFYETTYYSAIYANEISVNIEEISKDILWATNTEDAALTQERIDRAVAEMEVLDEDLPMLESTFSDSAMMESLKEAVTALEQVQMQVVALAENNQNEEALALYDESFVPAHQQVSDLLEQIGVVVDAEAHAKFMQSQYLALVVFILVILLALGCTMISMVLSKGLVASILTPIQELENAAHKLSTGDLEIEIAYQAEDELGQLADSFRDTCQTLKTVIGDLKYRMEELKNGNFQAESKCPESYLGELQSIHTNMEDMIDQLNGVMEQITIASEQVALGSSQMADSAQALAEGATDQAGAVEELNATIENMTAEAQGSAEYAASAFSKAEEYKLQADKGNQEMDELTKAMERISSASQEVQNIIGEIEDIASQTNLLSLNASIEAARAGEAGRGFAVVADQIGKLAASSGESAVRTRELIQKTLEEVASGTNRTVQTREAFEQIVSGVEALAEAARYSSETSTTQVATMEQVEKGIEQISSVVQNNSAAAQETSATSEELSAQATNLNELVGHFQLRV